MFTIRVSIRNRFDMFLLILKTTGPKKKLKIFNICCFCKFFVLFDIFDFILWRMKGPNVYMNNNSTLKHCIIYPTVPSCNEWTPYLYMEGIISNSLFINTDGFAILCNNVNCKQIYPLWTYLYVIKKRRFKTIN